MDIFPLGMQAGGDAMINAGLIPRPAAQPQGFLSGLQGNFASNPLINLGLSILANQRQPGESAVAPIARGAMMGLQLTGQQQQAQSAVAQQQFENRLAVDQNRREQELLELKQQEALALEEPELKERVLMSMIENDPDVSTLGEAEAKLRQQSAIRIQGPFIPPSNEKRQTAAALKLDEMAAGNQAAVFEAKQSARTESARMQAMLDALDSGVYTGVGAELVNDFRGLLDAAGFLSEKGSEAVAGAGTIEQIETLAGVDMLQNWKGPTTDFEYKQGKLANPGITDPNASFRAKAEFRLKNNQYAELKAQKLEERLIEMGVEGLTGTQWRRFEDDFHEAYPPAEHLKIDSPIKQTQQRARQQPATSTATRKPLLELTDEDIDSMSAEQVEAYLSGN